MICLGRIAVATMMLCLMASNIVAAFRSTIAWVKPSKAAVLSAKAFGSPWDLIRDVDELLDQQFGSTMDDFYLYRPRLLGRLVDRPLVENFQPRLAASNVTEGMKLATPRYEISEDDHEFKLAVDVPGVKPADMKIKLEQDGRVLSLTGERKIQDGNWKSEMKFEKSFLLDKKIQSDKITANFSDGVVVITAPKVPLIEAKKDIEIPITEVNRGAAAEPKNELSIAK